MKNTGLVFASAIVAAGIFFSSNLGVASNHTETQVGRWQMAVLDSPDKVFAIDTKTGVVCGINAQSSQLKFGSCTRTPPVK